MTHDRAFLERCEAFLLHPSVRALSLAQRVDFLEQKGLSPEEITMCLKNIQQQNGLSKMIAPAAAAAGSAAVDSATGALVAKRSPTTWTGAIISLIKRYGVVTLMTVLLGYGYIRFRQKAMEQLMIKTSLERVQRRARRATKIEGMLGLISDQQAQYQQAARLLQGRVTKFQEAKKAAEAPPASTVSAAALVRKIELESLQKELFQLKSAVVDAFIHPKVETVKPAQVEEIVEPANDQKVADRLVYDDIATGESADALVAASSANVEQPDTLTDTEDQSSVVSHNKDDVTKQDAKQAEKASIAENSKPSGIKLSLTPREEPTQGISASSSCTSSSDSSSVSDSDVKESATPAQTPVMLSS